jgi:hypothetical protein
MEELTDDKKQAILYDYLPHYYSNKMKEADKVPLEMILVALRNYALNMEETSVNPGLSENEDEGAALCTFLQLSKS